jgi:hypothetical protein
MLLSSLRIRISSKIATDLKTYKGETCGVAKYLDLKHTD